MYNNLYESTTMTNSAGLGAAMTVMILGIFIFSIILSLILIISNWKIFTKANKPGWASIVPIYNTVIMIQIAKLPIWYLLLFFIPIANIYAMFKIYIEIAKKFGKSSGFGIGMALLSIIFIPLLAFSDSVYEDEKETTTNNTSNTFDATNVINANNENSNTLEPSMSSIETVNTVLEPSIPVTPTEPTINPVETVEEVNTVIPESSIPVMPTEPTINPVETVEEVNTVIPEPSIPVMPTETATVTPETVVPNAFNSQPIQTENKVVEQTNEVNTEVEEELKPEIIAENLEQVASVKKLCKNCGIELPDIVSICPSCGTDNE